MAKINLPKAKRVLAFNSARILVGVFRSGRAAAELSTGQAQAISNACTGKVTTAMGYYWRHEHPEVELEMSDIGSLKIEEYDELCNEEREYKSSRDIKGKRVLPLKNK